MIPAPDFVSDNGAKCWRVTPDVTLWWTPGLRSGGPWTLRLTPLSDNGVSVVIAVDLGDEAPSDLLLLLVHAQRMR